MLGMEESPESSRGERGEETDQKSLRKGTTFPLSTLQY
jgi:hypothetical protein